MIEYNRYSYLRKRLIELHNIIVHRYYNVRVAPFYRMSRSQLQNREEITFNGSYNDGNYYKRPNNVSLSIVDMIDIIPNLERYSLMGLARGEIDIRDIYNTCQDYIECWCEIIRLGTFNTPPMSELRAIESVSQWVFNYYVEIESYARHARKNKSTDGGLSGIASMLLANTNIQSAEVDDSVKFTSHLDNLGGWKAETYANSPVNYDKWS